MWSLRGSNLMTGEVVWVTENTRHWSGRDDELVKVFFDSYSSRQAPKKREWLLDLAAHLDGKAEWIRSSPGKWTFDLDKMKELFPDLRALDWFTGVAAVEPEMQTDTRVEIVYGSDGTRYDSEMAWYITPETVRMEHAMPQVPIEIGESLLRFRSDHPDPAKVAFIMMQFGQTQAHEKIVVAIRKGLATRGITGLRADDKDYHDDLLPNVLTYLWGCGFGVAVYERLEDESVNPNVSLEVGYLMALRKPICLLKDRTLKSLNTDLIGKIHISFDPQAPGTSIPSKLSKWFVDRGLATSDGENSG